MNRRFFYIGVLLFLFSSCLVSSEDVFDTGITGMATSNSGTADFSTNKVSLSAEVLQGDSAKEKLMVYNNIGRSLNISLNITGSLTDYVSVSSEEFELAGKGSRVISVDFQTLENSTPGTYRGLITFSDDEGTKVVEVSLEIKLKQTLFSVEAEDISASHKPNYPHISRISILNSGDTNNFEVDLYSDVRDLDGKVYVSNSESFLLEDELELESSLVLPKDMRGGDYIFYTRASHDEIIDITTYEFTVEEGLRYFLRTEIFASVLGGIVVLLILRRLFLKWRNDKRIKRSIIQMEALAEYNEDAEDEDKKEGKDKSNDDKDGEKRDEVKDD